MRILRSRWISAVGLGAAAAVILLAGACSENAGETVRPTPAEGQTTASGVVLDISARDFSFVPNRVQMRPNQAAEIRFKPEGAARHSLAIYEDAEYEEMLEGAEIPATSPGETKSLALNPPSDATKLFFRCEIHHEMTGEIEVGPDTAG
jgi:plastocyanin